MNNKLKIFFLFLTLSLTGCFSTGEDSIKQIDKAKNEFLCKDKGGVNEHYVSNTKHNRAYSSICENGYKVPREDMEKIVIDDEAFYPKNLYSENPHSN